MQVGFWQIKYSPLMIAGILLISSAKSHALPDSLCIPQ
ncbi:hypothetical protein YPPY13_2412 [Yersinia pestis PY-13]|uniref:Uncharacterized protein n=1 Tax=Yersinia pestis PY-08 TaxID=992134 RepID=A0AB72ZM96_YERPE|nr:hypothetical protein YpF1991016_0656 [Yersinia pestis biovar Orientalis str. F1991016]EDR60529.1 hypothetical protein YpUG050454_0114 [Yersinia pestis biovar Antiqua str. UG05-0454]EIQ88481.1 hypothetical protein YPPY01_2329 [Yersinia pestis PY-01]EIQ90043.1 hypothetical protein YPPY02_2361 [Yersinia pestis PY-02]EIQ91076.1 hypothetical protein YPPY03_2411 [Yersinia pestis PY-03]EIR02319.1 hypothetical protein YPPY04_2377 [Yersinia pestis PY-04]EIR06777.1 hypothetical protein YPPY06_2424 [